MLFLSLSSSPCNNPKIYFFQKNNNLLKTKVFKRVFLLFFFFNFFIICVGSILSLITYLKGTELDFESLLSSSIIGKGNRKQQLHFYSSTMAFQSVISRTRPMLMAAGRSDVTPAMAKWWKPRLVDDGQVRHFNFCYVCAERTANNGKIGIVMM